MPDSEAAALDGAKARKERVHTTMLIELLVTLVFLAMAFAFVQKDEQKASNLQHQIDTLQRRLDDAQLENARLLRENAQLRRFNEELRISLARWMAHPPKSLPASDEPVTMPGREFSDLQNRLANALQMVKELQKENAELRRRIAGGKNGGTDLPNCTVTAGFLLSIDLLGNGSFRISPDWKPGAEAAAREVPGISELVSGGEESAAQFQQGAERVATWGRQQAVPCRFRVEVVEHHSDLDLYKRQLQTIEYYFYDKRH